MNAQCRPSSQFRAHPLHGDLCAVGGACPASRARRDPQVRRVPAEHRQVRPAARRLLSVRERQLAGDDADSGRPLQLRRVHVLQEDAERDLQAILEEAAKSKARRPAPMHRRSATTTRAFSMRPPIEARGLEPLSDEARSHRRDSRPARTSRGYIGRSQRMFVAHPFALLRRGRREELHAVHQHRDADRAGHAGSRLLPVR